MKNPYKLSKDYDRLFQLLTEQQEIIGFIDHKVSALDTIVRDVCLIQLRDYLDGDIHLKIISTTIKIKKIHSQERYPNHTILEFCKEIFNAVNLEFIEP